MGVSKERTTKVHLNGGPFDGYTIPLGDPDSGTGRFTVRRNGRRWRGRYYARDHRTQLQWVSI